MDADSGGAAMSAAAFDPDEIMREVRAKVGDTTPANSANLLNNAPNFSRFATLAASTAPDRGNGADAPASSGRGVNENYQDQTSLRRNREAQFAGLTDRWCDCGAFASLAWPAVGRRDHWRCLECGPAQGRG